jgi:hypothetical protein
MSAQFLTTATLAIAIIPVLPARAADSQLINLMTPDAIVLAGVNVDQAKTSPFGQYVLSQVPANDPELQKLTTLTGFDPTRDVHELLCGSNGTPQTGVVAVRGTFNPAMITTAATGKGAVTETYAGVTILEDPKQTHGLAFLSSSIAVTGDVADVKAAIDRQKTPTPLPAAVIVQINQWSGSQDAWVISTVPPSSLHPAAATGPKAPAALAGAQGAFQTIQSAAGGVKFGSNVLVTVQAVADNAQDATSAGDVVKMLASLAAMQAANDPTATSLLQSLQVSTSGTTLNVSISLTEDQLQQVVKPKSNMRPGGRPATRHM